MQSLSRCTPAREAHTPQSSRRAVAGIGCHAGVAGDRGVDRVRLRWQHAGSRQRRGAEALRQRRGAEYLRYRVLERRRNARPDHQRAVVAGQVRDPATLGCDDRASRPERLLHDQRLTLPAARHRDDVRRAEQRRDVGPLSQEPHREIRLPGERGKLPGHRAVAREHQHRRETAAPEADEGLKEHVETLLPGQPARGEYDLPPLGPDLCPGLCYVIVRRRGESRRYDHGERDVPRARIAHPACKVGRDAEHRVGPPGDKALQAPVDDPGPNAGRSRVVHGDLQRGPAPPAGPAQRERGGRPGAQAMRVHDIGVAAREQPAQPAHRRCVAARARPAADVDSPERNGGEQALRALRAEDGDGQAPRGAPFRQHRHMAPGAAGRGADYVGDPLRGHCGAAAAAARGAAPAPPPASAAGAPRPPGTLRGPGAAGRRPSMSRRCSSGVCAMTLVKLTFSLAAVRPVIAARTVTLAARGSVAAAAAPSMPPSALAPESPSIARSPRSSGSTESAAPTGAAAPAAPAEVTPSAAPAASATLIARPGRRSNKVSRVAPPATRPVLITTSTADPPPAPWPEPTSTLAASPVAPIPTIFTAPLVTSPLARAPRWPRKPRRSPRPFRSPSARTAAAPAPASASAPRRGAGTRGRTSDAAAAPAAAAGPSSRVTGSPRWLVRAQASRPPGGRWFSAA